MADLTFYFPSTGSAAHSPSISATWLHEEGATRLPLVSTKSDSARANRKASVWAVGTQTNLAQQYVSAAQAAHEWTTNDSIELQFSAMREANCTAGYMYLIVRVFNADCSSVRGTLYDGAAPTNVSNSQFTNRAMVSGGGHVHVQNAVSMSANDHIVVELGFTSTVSSAWAGCTYKVGDNESSDLPVDETTETWDSYNPWIAFTFATTGYSLSCDGGSYAVTGTSLDALKGSKVGADSGSYKVTGTAASLLYAAPHVCDMYFDWHTGSDGQAVTTTIAAGSCRPTSPTYTPGVYPQSPLTNLHIEADAACPISGKVKCDGLDYDIEDATQGLIYDHSANVSDFVLTSVTSNPTKMSMGFLIKTTLDDAWKYHALSAISGTGEWALLSKYADLSGIYFKLETSGHYWGSITISANTWYWVTIQYDSVAEKAYLAVYLASTMAQVGSTIEADLTDATAVSSFAIGQYASEGNSDSASTWFGPVMVDWTDATFPLRPYNPANYTLSCEGGSYSLTGTAVSPLRAAKLDAAAGSYALTGQAAGTYYGRKLAAEAGSYAVSGQAAGVLRTARIAAEAGAYALTGTAVAALYGRRLAADGGSYALTGASIGALYGRVLAAESGEYALTGSDAGTYFGRVLAAESGTYAITGSDVTLIYTGGTAAYVLTCEGGAYALTGAAVGLLRAAKVAAESGAYVVTGAAASTLLGRLLDAGAGVYAVTGAQAGLIRAAKIAAEGGTYALTGADAGAYYGRHLDAEAGLYSISGQAAALLRAARIGADAGAYAVAGTDASLRYTYGVPSAFIFPVQPRNRIVAAPTRQRIKPVPPKGRISKRKST